MIGSVNTLKSFVRMRVMEVCHPSLEGRYLLKKTDRREIRNACRFA